LCRDRNRGRAGRVLGGVDVAAVVALGVRVKNILSRLAR
jgi:hypothetical protein